MTNDNDLIRRGDAISVAVRFDGGAHTKISARIAALPAVAASQPECEGAAHIVEYTNWRGETARRVIRPIRMWWGKTEYHPEDQWMLTAYDCEKEATRDFAWQDMRPIPNPATSVAASQPADPVTNADSRQRVLDKNGDLVGSKLEMKLRSDWRKISKHHGLAHNGVLEADIVRAFLAAIDVQPDPRDAQIAALVEAADIVIAAMHDGEVWGRAVNAAMPILNADLDQSAWNTVDEVRRAITSALVAAKGGDA